VIALRAAGIPVTATCKILDTALSLGGYERSAPRYAALEDRTPASANLSKAYFTRVGTSGAAVNIAAGLYQQAGAEYGLALA
jgi:hypothetical protein